MDALNKQRPPAAENLGKMGAPRAHLLQSAAVPTARASSSVEKPFIIERNLIVGMRGGCCGRTPEAPVKAIREF